MSTPAGLMRGLPFPVSTSASNSSNIAGEPECSGSSAVVFPDNPDEQTFVPFWLSLNEYNMLASCVDVGADIAYSTDAQRVLYVWLRNTRCADMICEFLTGCTLDALGQAFGPQQYVEIQGIAAAQQAEYAADYTGTPSSINPDTFDTNFDGAGDLADKTVLCSAAEAFVKLFAAQKAQQLKLAFGAAAVMLALITLLVPGLGWILASGIYIAIGTATLITGVTYAAAIAALEDETALHDVSCCLNDSLTGLAVTEANWNAALAGCGFGSGTNAEIVQGFVLEAMAGNYLTFLNILGTAKHAQDNGEPVECACFEPDTYELYATLPNFGGTLIDTLPFVSGVPFEAEAVLFDTVYYGVAIEADGAFTLDYTINPDPVLSPGSGVISWLYNDAADATQLDVGPATADQLPTPVAVLLEKGTALKGVMWSSTEPFTLTITLS